VRLVLHGGSLVSALEQIALLRRVSNTSVYGNRVYTDDGPQGYNTNIVGLFVNLKL
jgi:hypothetical protein